MSDRINTDAVRRLADKHDGIGPGMTHRLCDEVEAVRTSEALGWSEAHHRGSRVATLETALRNAKSDLLRYGRHDSDCIVGVAQRAGRPVSTEDERKCSCGLTAALGDQEAPKSQRAADELTRLWDGPDYLPSATEERLHHIEAVAGNVVLVDDEADLLVPDWRAVVGVLREAIDELRAALGDQEATPPECVAWMNEYGYVRPAVHPERWTPLYAHSHAAAPQGKAEPSDDVLHEAEFVLDAIGARCEDALAVGIDDEDAALTYRGALAFCEGLVAATLPLVNRLAAPVPLVADPAWLDTIVGSAPARTDVVDLAAPQVAPEPERCPTCGSDEPAWPHPRGLTEAEARHAIPCPDPFHSQSEPCEDCGDTGVIVHEGTPWPILRALGYTDTDSEYEPCPRGCKPEGEKK